MLARTSFLSRLRAFSTQPPDSTVSPYWVIPTKSSHAGRRRCVKHEALDQLAGFPRFYRSLVESLFPHVSPMQANVEPSEADRACNVTLLIKVCPQDAALMEDQVRHIITQLSYPKKLGAIVLAIDRYEVDVSATVCNRRPGAGQRGGRGAQIGGHGG